MLTILGNLRINSLTRLEHLKSSFASFDTVSDDWLINVRGTFRNEVIEFLKGKLGKKMRLFNLLDDSRGWITNANEMLKEAKNDYILVWNEDHVNIAPQNIIKTVVAEMKTNKVDYLGYSWWMFGKSRSIFTSVADKIGLNNDKNISWLNLTKEKWNVVLKTNGTKYFLVSMCGIFKKDFLRKMWHEDQKRLPASLKKLIFKILATLTKVGIVKTGHKALFDKINRILFRNKIRKYPIVTPFEMEKSSERIDVLPMIIAVPKQELFACIDDDVNETGYSLIERGLYRNPRGNVDTKEHIQSILTEIKTVLSKIDQKQIDILVKQILSARRIIASGAGRVGMALKGFVMRLKHLGLDAYVLGDANVPALKQQDLFLVCSGSGETQTIYELVLIAQKNQANIALVTGNPQSRMGKIAQSIVEIKAPSKTKPVENFVSIQPMTTLNEQCLAIFFDAVVLRLMQELDETHDTMWERHSNLE